MKTKLRQVFAGIFALGLLSSMSLGGFLTVSANEEEDKDTSVSIEDFEENLDGDPEEEEGSTIDQNDPTYQAQFRKYRLGDINHDTEINIADVLSMKKAILFDVYTDNINTLGDLNQDEKVMVNDLVLLKKVVLGINEEPDTYVTIDTSGLGDTTLTSGSYKLNDEQKFTWCKDTDNDAFEWSINDNDPQSDYDRWVNLTGRIELDGSNTVIDANYVDDDTILEYYDIESAKEVICFSNDGEVDVSYDTDMDSLRGYINHSNNDYFIAADYTDDIGASYWIEYSNTSDETTDDIIETGIVTCMDESILEQIQQIETDEGNYYSLAVPILGDSGIAFSLVKEDGREATISSDMGSFFDYTANESISVNFNTLIELDADSNLPLTIDGYDVSSYLEDYKTGSGQIELETEYNFATYSATDYNYTVTFYNTQESTIVSVVINKETGALEKYDYYTVTDGDYVDCMEYYCVDTIGALSYNRYNIESNSRLTENEKLEVIKGTEDGLKLMYDVATAPTSNLGDASTCLSANYEDINAVVLERNQILQNGQPFEVVTNYNTSTKEFFELAQIIDTASEMGDAPLYSFEYSNLNTDNAGNKALTIKDYTNNTQADVNFTEESPMFRVTNNENSLTVTPSDDIYSSNFVVSNGSNTLEINNTIADVIAKSIENSNSAE